MSESAAATLEQETLTPPPAADAPIPADVNPPSQDSVTPASDFPETGDDYLKRLEGDDGTAKPEPRRKSILDDPRIVQNRETVKERTSQRQSLIKGDLREKMVRYGLDEAISHDIAGELGDLFNNHNSDVIQLGHSVAAMQAVEAVNGNVAEGMQQGLEAAVYKPVKDWLDAEWAAGRSPPYDQVFAKAQEAARTGYLPRKVAKDAYDEGFKNGKAAAEKVANGASSKPLGVNGMAAGKGDKWTTKREARDLHAQDKLSTTEMRRINADPSIPEGYS